MKIPLLASFAILAMSICFPLAAFAEDQESYGAPLVLEVQLDRAPKLSHLKPGDRLQGKVKHEVYSGERKLIPAGTPIVLTVATTQRRRQKPSDRWPWVVRLFAVRKINYPSSLAAMVSLPDGSKHPMSATLVSATHEVRLSASVSSTASSHVASQAWRASMFHKGRHESGAPPTLLLEVERPPQEQVLSRDLGSTPPTTPGNLAAGTVAHVILLRGLRASTSRAGDTFLARLSEPVFLNFAVVLPEGVLIRGKVVRSVAPRRLCRAGSLSLSFTQVKFPTGGENAIAASPSGVVVDRASGLRMNAEGGLMGARPGKARLLVDLGMTGGISKVTDDSLQLILEALISTATDASTAGSAKIVAAAFSGLYLLTRHGRDVILPRYTNLEITFDRPVLLVSTR